MQEGKKIKSDDDDDLDSDEDDSSSSAKKPIRTTFELNDTLYAEAELEDTDTVYLWLGVRFLFADSALTHQVFVRPTSCYRTRYRKLSSSSNQN